MLSFESLGTVSYSPPIVTMAASLAILEIFIWRYSTSTNDLNLKSGFGVVQGHLKWRGSIDHVRLSIGSPL